MLNTEMKTKNNITTTTEMPASDVGGDYQPTIYISPDPFGSHGGSCCCCCHKHCDDGKFVPDTLLEDMSPEVNHFGADAADANTEFNIEIGA